MNTKTAPANAKTKTIKEPYLDRSYKVLIHDEGDTGWCRQVQVWTIEGTYLGAVQQFEHESERHLYGNVASFGARRMKWFPDGQLWNDHESMAAAIRTLVNDHENQIRWAKERAARNDG